MYKRQGVELYIDVDCKLLAAAVAKPVAVGVRMVSVLVGLSLIHI